MIKLFMNYARYIHRLVRNIYNRILIFFINKLSFFGNNYYSNKIRMRLLKLIGVNSTGSVFIDYGFDCLVPSNIHLGKNISFGHNNKIWAFESITIGNYVQTAIGLTIVSGTHDNGNYEPKKGNAVTIGDGCWIGANVTILAGVDIGIGCIVGAGSVVTKSIPDFTIAVGVPARVIKKRTPSQKILSPFGWYDITEIKK